jgi:cytochrome c553
MPRILLIALVLALPGRLAAQSSEGLELFEKKIRPLLAARCHSCHGPKMQMGGLDLSTAAGFARGSDNGPVVSAERPGESRLIRVLGYEEKLKMPPTGKLDPEQLAAVAAWVRLGAPWPKAEIPPAAAGTTAEQRAFWSFQPVRRHEPPPVRNSGWIQNGIDNFILARLEEKGISPAPPAERLALLRRATFDLTGLPPTEAEIADFMADRSQHAFARVVERLLASPRYGERWGRHWLDVARYADSTGLDEDHRYPHAWRYRDYVIDAFNRDLPFDRFITEQLAGDLLPADKPGEVNARGIVATGFLALGPKPVAQQDKMQMVYDVVDEQIEVTSKAFMGLTVACARCHDHKFDPILTADYYALASIFASTKSFSKIEGTVSQLYHAPLVPASVYEAYEQHQKKIVAARKAIDAVIEAEAALYAARLRPRLADYMVAAREVSGGRSAAEVARASDLDPAVLEKWVQYLKEKENDPPAASRRLAPRRSGGAAPRDGRVPGAVRRNVGGVGGDAREMEAQGRRRDRGPDAPAGTAELRGREGSFLRRGVVREGTLRAAGRGGGEGLLQGVGRAACSLASRARRAQGIGAAGAAHGRCGSRGDDRQPADLPARQLRQSGARGAQALSGHPLPGCRAAFGHRQRPARAGALAGGSRASADRQGHGEPRLAMALRRRPGPHRKQLREARRAPHAP